MEDTLKPSDLPALLRARHLSSTGEARRIRLAAPLSMAEVALAAVVSVSTLSRWETGMRRPTGPAACRWARLLDQVAAREPARVVSGI